MRLGVAPPSSLVAIDRPRGTRTGPAPGLEHVRRAEAVGYVCDGDPRGRRASTPLHPDNAQGGEPEGCADTDPAGSRVRLRPEHAAGSERETPAGSLGEEGTDPPPAGGG